MRARTALPAAAACALLFAVVAVDVTLGGPLDRLDRRGSGWVLDHVPEEDRRVRWEGDASLAGGWPWVHVAAVAAIAALAVLGAWRRAAFLGAAFILLGPAVPLLKDAFGRARPEQGYAEGAAYPSGHAAQAALVWGFLLAAMAAATRRRWPGPGGRLAAALLVAGGVAVALLVGAGRVLGGVHYPGDVLGGYLLAGTLGFLALGLASALPGPPPPVLARPAADGGEGAR